MQGLLLTCWTSCIRMPTAVFFVPNNSRVLHTSFCWTCPRWIRVNLVMHAEIVRLVFICIEYCSVLPNVHSSLLVLSVARLWAMTLQFALMLTHTDEHFVGGQIDVVLANVCFLWWVKCRLHDSFFAHSTFVYCQSTSLTSAHLQCVFTHQCIFMQIFMPFVTW